MDRLATLLADGHVTSISRRHRAHPRCIEQLARNHPRRACLERFIADVYLRRYGARISHFAEQLIAFQDAAGNWVAAAGYTPATDAPLFVEQYVDAPIEEALTARIGAPVARHLVVEAGNLAAVGPGAARTMIVSLAVLLHRLQLGWVVLTGTRAWTGARRGTTFPGMVGVETDRVGAGVPRPMEVLSVSPVDCGGRATVAHSAYYTVPSGAAVFSAGTLLFEPRLGPVPEDPGDRSPQAQIRRMMANVLTEFARGPAGRRHPAEPNLDRLGIT